MRFNAPLAALRGDPLWYGDVLETFYAVHTVTLKSVSTDMLATPSERGRV
jgi:hypothetical protein